MAQGQAPPETPHIGYSLDLLINILSLHIQKVFMTLHIVMLPHMEL